MDGTKTLDLPMPGLAIILFGASLTHVALEKEKQNEYYTEPIKRFMDRIK
jgi:hypothetical protein